MKKILVLTFLCSLFIGNSAVLGMNDNMLYYNRQNINSPRYRYLNESQLMRNYQNNSILNNSATTSSNSLDSKRRVIGYKPTYRSTVNYNTPMYYNSQRSMYPNVVTTRVTPTTTRRVYTNSGNAITSSYSEETTRYYGAPTVTTYSSGYGNNQPRFLSW